MSPATSLPRQFLHFAIGVCVLSLGVRTWIAMGLIVPVVVSAGSMAPALFGPHRSGACPACGTPISLGLEYASPRQTVGCPGCGLLRVAGDLEVVPGEGIWVDRVSFLIRDPRRWEPIVFRCPRRAREFCIKRVLGMPGERISIREGDLYADGRIVRKTLEEQRAVRIAVHASNPMTNRWRPAASSTVWTRKGDRWVATLPAGPENSASTRKLSFEPDGGWPLSDAPLYNADAFPATGDIRDLMLSARIACSGRSSACIQMTAGPATWNVHFVPAEATVWLEAAGRRVAAADLELPRESWRPTQSHELIVSRFDRQTLVAVDGVVWLEVHDASASAGEPVSGLAVEAGGVGTVSVGGLRVDRDIHHAGAAGEASSNAGTGPPTWQLGAGEWFVAGDNGRVSEDSRNWPGGPGLPSKLIVGKPLRPAWRTR